jgi:hypothetical protein
LTNETASIKKKSFLMRQKNIIIGLVITFIVLLGGYLFIVRPLLQDDQTGSTTNVELIWEEEVQGTGSTLLLFPHTVRTQIQKIDIHNPSNATQYVDWGFFYNEEADETNQLEADTFYLTDYEYAPYDDTSFSYLITAAGYTICSSRIEDHCTDFSKYGLDFDDLSEATYFRVTTRDQVTYTVIIGDQLPSGSGYYVRSYDEDVNLQTGETQLRDSVYVLTDVYVSDTLLTSPLSLVTAYLTYPTSSSDQLDAFALWVDEERYYSNRLDADGNQVYDEDGKKVITWSPAIYAKPLDMDSQDPFFVFSGMSTYYLVNPSGYYASTELEDLFSIFEEFLGDEVLELGKTIIDEDGESYIGFEDEVFQKYSLDNPYYTLFYRYNDIDNYVYFSKLQEGSYYYAYSVNFNIICRVNLTTAYFMDWDLNTFVFSGIFYLQINNCESIEVNGSYYDLGIDNEYRVGLQDVNYKFQLEGTGSDLAVVEKNTGSNLDTKNFRQFYKMMLQTYIRDELEDEVSISDPFATFRVVTRETVVYKTDSDGNDTDEVDYIRSSVTRIYRFYEVTNGRSFCTVESIDEDGNSGGESGAFYCMTSSIEKILASAIDVVNGVTIVASDRF